MDNIDLESRLAISPTRRTIVKTGVKLAYAAPVLAASFRLSQMGVGAVSGKVCPPNLICDERRADCGNDDDGVCSNVVSIDPNSCICGNDACGPDCSTDADCQDYAPGSICQAPGTGCCGQTCIAPCGVAHATNPLGRGARTSNSAGS
jgi:hypothetical protein